ncbi:MAG: efflux RND transporter periplasmic adaptor subunit [bacterium]
MRKHISRFVKFITKKWVIATVVIILIIGAYIVTHSGSSVTFEASPVAIGNVIEKVSITGTVSPVDKADLAFQKSGTVARIAVKVGDSVKKGDLIASLENAADAAALASAQAQLAELQRGLRPEEYALDQANVNTASTTLANARKDAMNAVRDGYVKAQGALLNYSDTFFTNPQSPNPVINITVRSTEMQNAINNERLVITSIFSQWKNDIDTSSVANAAALITNAEGYLTKIKLFLSDLSAVVNSLTTGNSGMSQSAIDADVSTMNTALSTLTSAITSVSSADSELKNAVSGYTQATNQFNLQQAGSSADTIAAQAARVNQAAAALADDSITAPIDGLVTKVDPHVGEFAQAGHTSFSIQSAGAYKIEAYVPEADIAKVALGNTAAITLDAYGSTTFFPAAVTSIDPAETILEGVPTYKVTLMFVTPDTRIRSGMTANTDILTHEVDHVLVVPTRAITTTATSTTVRIVNADDTTFTTVPVTVNLKGSDGTTAITGGVKEGDKVVTYVK